MIAQYKRKSFYWGIPGAWLYLSGTVVRVSQDSIVDIITHPIILTGTILLVVGLSYYARAKGRNGFWGLFGLISPIGLIGLIVGVAVLACLKDITQNGIKATAQEQLPQDSADTEHELTIGPAKQKEAKKDTSIINIFWGVIVLIVLLAILTTISLMIFPMIMPDANPRALGNKLGIPIFTISILLTIIILRTGILPGTKIEATAQEQLPGTPDGIIAAVTMYPKAKTSRLAEYSLVLGIAAVATLYLTAVPGLILGIVALYKIKKNPETLKGRGLAIAGIVVSSVFCVFLFLHWRVVSLFFSSFFEIF